VYGQPRWKGVVNAKQAMALREFPRQALHAWRLAFNHPVTGARLEFEAPLPDDMRTLSAMLALTLPGARAGAR